MEILLTSWILEKEAWAGDLNCIFGAATVGVRMGTLGTKTATPDGFEAVTACRCCHQLGALRPGCPAWGCGLVLRVLPFHLPCAAPGTSCWLGGRFCSWGPVLLSSWLRYCF